MSEARRSMPTRQHSASPLPVRALGCGVLLFILVGAVGLVGWLLRIDPLVERLVSETNAFEGAAHPRPAHVIPPVPGAFGQAVGPLLPEVFKLPEAEPDSVSRPQEDDDAASEAWSRAFEALREQCRKVASGLAPLETMPTPCRNELERPVS